MAVLVEGISVIVRVAAIHLKFRGGWDGFKNNTPNSTLCADNELACVVFMAPDDVRFYIEYLEECGLAFIADGRAVDIVVVDQMHGPMTPCDWAEFADVPIASSGESTVLACRLKGSKWGQVFKPNGWTYEQSLRCSHGFVPSGKEDKSLSFLRHEGAVDVYLDRVTGKEIFVGRTGKV